MNRSRTYRFTPLIVAIGIVLGILIGSFYANHFSGRRLNIINMSSDKLNSLLHIVDDQYVDSVNIPDLVEKSLPEILKKLDPHSVYIPAKNAEESMQDLKGSFSGIGVQFMIFKDTVRVVKVISGGPSEKVGLQAGDRIVSVDGKTYVGKEVNSEETMKRLKGPRGTTVQLGIRRAGTKGLLEYSIVRGDVPIKSIDAVYMLDKTTGYIRIVSFGDTTYPEFLAALATLNHQGFENLVIDLRDNLGGYMAPAVQIANEFLPKGRLIVYTKGRKAPREEYTSTGRGSYLSMPLVVLVDESSASASEILAGAVQDNDRGTIIGRRTFGKGLVQIPIEFNDGSMLRLTKARYYTPSGRCVQKPYTPGDEEEYEMDLILRAEHGEYYSPDSIKTSGEQYQTRSGRIVYGGGGIIPDVFIPRDTLGINSYFREVYLSGLINQYAYAFVDENRKRLNELGGIDGVERYLKRRNIVEKFAAYAAKNGVKRRNRMINESHDLLYSYLSAGIINDIFGVEVATEYVNRTDPAVLKARLLLEKGEAFPEAPSDSTARTIACAAGMASELPVTLGTASPGDGQKKSPWSVAVRPAKYPFFMPVSVVHSPNLAVCPENKAYERL